MIKLTFKDGSVIYLNPACIESFSRYEETTYVRTNSRQFRVKETPEQVLSLMNESPLSKLRDELDLLDFQNIPGYSQPFYDAADVWKIIDKYIPEDEDD